MFVPLAFKQEEMMIQELAGIFPNTGTKYVAPELAPGNLIVDIVKKKHRWILEENPKMLVT